MLTLMMVVAAPALFEHASPPSVAALGSYEPSNATRYVYGQGLACRTPAAGKHGLNHSQCGWQIFPAASRTNYTAVNLTLDAYMPVNDSLAHGSRRPAFVLIHGGSYKGGDSTFAQGVAHCRQFASAGFAAFSINYRLAPDNGNIPAGWPANCGNPCTPRDCRTPADNRSCTQTNGWCPEVLAAQCQNASLNGDLGWMPEYAYPAVRDAKAAVRWVRAHAAEFAVDPDFVVVSGDSAGAASAVALGLLHERDYKSELSATEDPTLATINLEQSSAVQAVIDHWGTDWMARQLWARSAVGWEGQDDLYSTSNPPICIFHGTADKAMPFAPESNRIVGGYNRTGVPYAFFPIQGAGHGAWGTRYNVTECMGSACGGLLEARSGSPANWEVEIAWKFVTDQLRLGLRV